jgi:hypothetical protein
MHYGAIILSQINWTENLSLDNFVCNTVGYQLTIVREI